MSISPAKPRTLRCPDHGGKMSGFSSFEPIDERSCRYNMGGSMAADRQEAAFVSGHQVLVLRMLCRSQKKIVEGIRRSGHTWKRATHIGRTAHIVDHSGHIFGLDSVFERWLANDSFHLFGMALTGHQFKSAFAPVRIKAVRGRPTDHEGGNQDVRVENHAHRLSDRRRHVHAHFAVRPINVSNSPGSRSWLRSLRSWTIWSRTSISHLPQRTGKDRFSSSFSLRETSEEKDRLRRTL